LVGVPVDRHRERDDGVDVRRAVWALEAPAAAGVASNSGVDVGVQVRIVGMDYTTVYDRVIQALAGGDHACVRLWEGDCGDAALLPLLRHLAGIPTFEIARMMGTSIEQIEKTYGHLLPDALDRGRAALEAFDSSHAESFGH
jgi:hypothetical protein